MKTLLLILALVGLAVGYNYALVEHGPALYKAINGPEPIKAKAHKPTRR
jgi:hypothetical protein